jgi:hypothetical protein
MIAIWYGSKENQLEKVQFNYEKSSSGLVQNHRNGVPNLLY